MQGRLRLALYCFVPGLSSVYDTGVYPSVFGAKLFGNVPEGRFLCLQNKRCDMMGLKSVLFSGILCCPNRFIPPNRVWWIYIGQLGIWPGGG